MPRTYAQFLPLYESWMLAASPTMPGGRKYHDKNKPPAPLDAIAQGNHYDPLKVYWEVRKYTGDPSWDDVIDTAYYQWVTLFLSPRVSTQPYHLVTAGLRIHWEEEEDQDSADLIALLHRRSSAASNWSLEYLRGWPRSRDVAHALMAHLDAESIGCSPRPRRDELKDLALNHLKQWFDPTNAVWPTGNYGVGGPSCVAIQPFMVGLTLKALIEYWDVHRDPAIPPAIKFALDYLYDNVWNLTSNWGNNPHQDPSVQAFPYWDRNTKPLYDAMCLGSSGRGHYDGSGQPRPAPVLSPLIAHAWAWYAARIAAAGAERAEYLARHDDIIAGSAQPAKQKEYNQLIYLSVQGLRWRAEALAAPAAATAYTLTAPDDTTGRANELSGGFLAEINGAVSDPVTITLSDGAAPGTFLPTSLKLTTDHPKGRSRYAPAPASDGSSVSISATDDGGLSDPSPISYTVSGVAPFATDTEIIMPVWEAGDQGWSGAFTVRLFPENSVLPRSLDRFGSVIRLVPNPPKSDAAFDNTLLQAQQQATWVSATHEGTANWWIPAGRTEPFGVSFLVDDGVYNTAFGSSAIFEITDTGPDTTPPTVSLTGPGAGQTVSGTVTVSALASDNVGVAEVEFYVGGTLIGTDTTGVAGAFSVNWDTTGVDDGAHSITAKAYDAADNSATSSAVAVTVDNTTPPPADTTDPTVSLTAPAEGAILDGTVTISALATDDTGVARVEFHVGSTLIGTRTTPSSGSTYSLPWDSTGVDDGDYSLTATAYDAAGNSATSSAVSVAVDNVVVPLTETEDEIASAIGWHLASLQILPVPGDFEEGDWPHTAYVYRGITTPLTVVEEHPPAPPTYANTDILRAGLAHLTTELNAHRYHMATYATPAGWVELRVIFATKLLRLDDGFGNSRIEWTDMDFLIPAAGLVIDGAKIKPRRGHYLYIMVEDEVETFEVLPFGANEPAWRWSDPLGHTMFRVHTKHIDVQPYS